MSVDVVVEQEIAAPRELVAAFASDPANEPRWLRDLDRSEALTGGAFGAGTIVQRITSVFGRETEYVHEIVAFEPGRRMELRTIKAPFPLCVTYEFEDTAAGGTLARIHTTGGGHPIVKVAGPLLARIVRRSVAKDLATLRRVIEDAAAGGDGAAA